MLIQLIATFIRTFHLWEAVHILVITRHTFNVCSGTAHGQRFYNPVAHTLGKMLEVADVGIGIIAQFLELLYKRSKECREISNTIYGAMARVLEQEYLIVEISWRVIHRSSRD